MPIMLAGLGGLWSERAGVVNIGLEGMMILGTWGAGYFGYHYGAWAGVARRDLHGHARRPLHAIATVIFGVDHIISGVAINIIALGAVQYLAVADLRRPARRRPDPVAEDPRRPDDHDRPAQRRARRPRGARTWFFVSDLAARAAARWSTNLSLLVVIALLLLVLTWWVLWRTSFGLRLRSCGESPSAAESLGVNVLRYKFVAVLISGGLAGLGGGFLAMVASSNYRDGQTGGRGYIGLAAMIFGNWRPGGLLAGSRPVRLHRDARPAPGRRLGARAAARACAVLALAAGGLAGPAGSSGVAAVVIGGVGVAARRRSTSRPTRCPSDFTRMTPYVVTLLVLAFASQRLRMPAADGQIYRKGSAG